MSRVGFKSVVFHGDSCLGEADTFPAKDPKFRFPKNEIRISHLSPSSERCPPLSILQTISPFAIQCKLESKSTSLSPLYASCFKELKTAVVLLGGEEVHLVAMPTKQENLSCFWCCSVPTGLYNSCLGMLNLRCLAIVFDLDETLIVANTMKSFEDKIEFLQRRISCETDSFRAQGMKAELKRYADDRLLLKQYSESDQVTDNGKIIKILPEEVPQISGNPDSVVRPVIRLHDRNIVLTRINPEVRDTSVLVRLRPAWEELRSYLTAKGRKRFEVYVCTMAERDYALEMWRLLDPEAHLISSKQLLDRVVCVKSGLKKSLPNVFHGVICHPRMAMVIDDRLKVWDDKDQPRVHVVPPFTPYYAPQAEMASAVPVLCVARNVACNVRGGFFKQFDENILRRIFELFYEDDVANLPFPPDVSDYLITEDVAPNGILDLPVPEGMGGAEVERRFNRLEQKHVPEPGFMSVSNNPDLRAESSHQAAAISSSATQPPMTRATMPSQKPGLLGASPRPVGPMQSEMNPDTRRRLLTLPNGQGLRDHGPVGPLIPRPPGQVLVAPIQPNGGWVVGDEINNAGQLNRRTSGISRESDLMQVDKYQASRNSHNQITDGVSFSEKFCLTSQAKAEEAHLGDGKRRQNHANSGQSSAIICNDDGGMPLIRVSSNNGDAHLEAAIATPQTSTISINVLQEIGRRCGSKIEFKSAMSAGKDLQFSVEVMFTGEKIGVGMGKTRKEAQLQAAENALCNLADKYVAYTAPESGKLDNSMEKASGQCENGFLMDTDDSSGMANLPSKEALPSSTNSEDFEGREESKRLPVVVSMIRDLCMGEDLHVLFQDNPPDSMTLSKEYYSQVKVSGRVLGKGTSFNKEGAQLQAADEALESLRSMLTQQGPKRSSSPRELESILAKRPKDEI